MLHFTNIGPVDLFKHLARHNLNQWELSQADSCQGRNVSFNPRWKNPNVKVTEHEVPGVTLRTNRAANSPALDFSDLAINTFGEKL